MPDHKLLAAQAAKDRSYFPALTALLPAPCDKRTFQEDDWISHRIGAEKVFVTSLPLLSKDECTRAIHVAEAHAQEVGGWSTARHYGVPTTDVAIHEIPELLRWFNGVLASRLCPLLRSQFGALIFHCHDAFLVRYSADEGQRHLPVHMDQSTHSVVLTLNEGFEGGGTFFCALGRTLAASEGHCLSFRGDQLLHGGDPVTRGTRYIIAVFLFGEPDPLEPPAKRTCGVLRKWW